MLENKDSKVKKGELERRRNTAYTLSLISRSWVLNIRGSERQEGKMDKDFYTWQCLDSF